MRLWECCVVPKTVYTHTHTHIHAYKHIKTYTATALNCTDNTKLPRNNNYNNNQIEKNRNGKKANATRQMSRLLRFLITTLMVAKIKKRNQKNITCDNAYYQANSWYA